MSRQRRRAATAVLVLLLTGLDLQDATDDFVVSLAEDTQFRERVAALT